MYSVTIPAKLLKAMTYIKPPVGRAALEHVQVNISPTINLLTMYATDSYTMIKIMDIVKTDVPNKETFYIPLSIIKDMHINAKTEDVKLTVADDITAAISSKDGAEHFLSFPNAQYNYPQCEQLLPTISGNNPNTDRIYLNAGLMANALSVFKTAIGKDATIKTIYADKERPAIWTSYEGTTSVLVLTMPIRMKG